ncbi:hypothetical protein D3C81_2242450 [compost metagenome]
MQGCLRINFLNYLKCLPRDGRVVVINQFFSDFAGLWVPRGFKQLKAHQVACGTIVMGKPGNLV